MLRRRLLALATMTAALSSASPVVGQELKAGPLTLEDAVAMALDQSHGLEAARQSVVEKGSVADAAHANYFPRLLTDINYTAYNSSQGIVLPRGSLGVVPGLGPFPDVDSRVTQGGEAFLLAVTSLQQPLTQIHKIGLAHDLALAAYDSAQADLAGVEQAVVIGTTRTYFGLLIARKRLEVAEQRVEVAQAQVAQRATAVASGTALDVAGAEAQVGALQARQALMEAQDQSEDLRYRLTDLLGLPADTPLELVSPEDDSVFEPDSLETYVAAALSDNPEVQIAQALVDKARSGVALARAEYIPDVSLVGTYIFTNAAPFLPRNTFGVGIQANWTIFDFGQRRGVRNERGAQLAKAQANLERVRGQVRGDVESAYRGLRRSEVQLETAQEAVRLRVELARLRGLQTRSGAELDEVRMGAEADRGEAEAQLLGARLGYRLAVLELRRLSGRPVSPSP